QDMSIVCGGRPDLIKQWSISGVNDEEQHSATLSDTGGSAFLFIPSLNARLGAEAGHTRKDRYPYGIYRGSGDHGAHARWGPSFYGRPAPGEGCGTNARDSGSDPLPER